MLCYSIDYQNFKKDVAYEIAALEYSKACDFSHLHCSKQTWRAFKELHLAEKII